MAKDFLSKYVKSGSRKSRQSNSKSNSWISNALKSVGYSSFDVLTELMPSTVDAAKTTATIGNDIATSIQKARTSDRSLKNAMERNYYVGLGKDILKNSLEDLKSGKFYNKERTDQLFASMDDDLDIGDVDFGDEDFDMDEMNDSIESFDGMAHASFNRKKGGNNEVTNIVVGTDLGPDSAIVKATEFQTETSINVGQAVIGNSKVNNRAMMTMVGGLRNEVTASLSSISDNISTMTQTISESLGKHMTLSAKYYEDSISLQTQILEHLRSTATGTDFNTRKFKEYNNVLDIVTSGGALDLNAYKNLIKKQANNYIDNNMVLSQLKFMNDNRDSLQMVSSSPLQKMVENSIKGMIPKVMQNAMTSFDNQLKETTVAALNQVSGLRRSNNPILNAIGSIFGVQNKIDISKVDKSAYNKGAMSWTGIDHQALTNVIPTLLRKIYASVSGTQEIGFDYNQGIFRNVKDMETDAANEKLRRETSGYTDYKSGFREFLNNNFAASKEEKDEYYGDFEKFISKLVRDTYGGRTFRRGGRNGKQKDANGDELDDIRDLLGARSSDDTNVQLIRSYFKYLERTDKAALTRFFGNGLQEQRASLNRQNREIQNDPIKYNTMYEDTGLKGAHRTDAHLDFKDENDKSRVTGVKSGVAAGTIDKYGKNSNYYLREILNTLTTGIYVVPIGGFINGEDNPDNSDMLSAIEGRRRGVINSFRSDKNNLARENDHNRAKPSAYNEERRNRDIEKGKFDINGGIDSDIVAMSASSEETPEMNTEDKSFIGKVMGKIPEDSGLGRILGRIRKTSNKMGEKGTGIFNTLNNALFDVVFGDGDGRRGAASIFNKAMGVLRSGFTSFSTFLDNKIFKPLDNALFGEDGFINKLKQSDFGQKISDTFNNIKSKVSSFILGDVGADNKRYGGIFSETANSLKDIGTQVKAGILGEKGPDGKPLPIDQDNSVLGNLKRLFKRTSDNIGNTLGIEKSDETLGTRINNTINAAFNRITERTTEWTNNIFGRKDDNGNELNSVFNSEFASQFKEDMKGQKGYIGATSTIGLLSSFFLPGGPIGGALIGAGVGIVSKSTGLKDFLFGPEDDNGERVGGLVNKEVQDFFKKNKTGIAVGAVGGMASSIGLLPSFFLPGGPIGGALIGAGTSLIAKSGAFNTLIYGEGGTKDDPTGGLMANIKRAFGKDKDLKNVGLDAGIGAGVGLLGSFFLPGGPLIHALLGSAISIGTATDKFKNWFFGEEGADGKRSGGVFNKFSDYMKEKIFTPLSTSVKLAQSHIMGFVEENMVLPFKYAIDPLVKEAKHAKDVIGEKISGVFDSLKTSLNNRVVKPIGETLDKYLITPIKNTLNKLFSGLGKVVGGIISAPFKMIGSMGWNAYDTQRKRGKDEYINNAGREGTSIFGRVKGALKRTGMRLGVVDRSGVKAAQYSQSGASYEAGQDIERRQRYQNELAEIRARREAERNNIRMGISNQSSISSPKRHSKKTENGRNTTRTGIRIGPSGATRVGTEKHTRISLNRDQKKIYKNAYKEAYNAGFRGDELREYVSLFGSGSKNNTSSTRVSSGNARNTKIHSSSLGRDSKYKPESHNINTNIGIDSTRVKTKDYKPTKSTKTSGDYSKDSGSAIQSIRKDVSKISDSVYGQLNGVGSNVNKIYRLLLNRFGKKDEDIKGDNNKEYVGFFGKLRTALNNPINAVKNIITTPFRKIADVGHGIANSIKNVGSGITRAGKLVITGIGNIVKGLGKVGLDLLKIPIDLVHTGLSAVRAALPAIGEAVKAGVNVIGTGLKVAGDVLVTGVQTVGNTLVGAAQGLGQLIGGAMSGLGNLLSAFGLIGKDTLKGIWSGLKVLGKGALSVGEAVLTTPGKLIGSILDRIGGGRGKGGSLFGKGPVHVIVDSGILDKVKLVKVVEIVKNMPSNNSESGVKNNTVTRVSGEPTIPMNLQTFASDRANINQFNKAISLTKDKFKSAGDDFRNKLQRNDNTEHVEQVERGSREAILNRLNTSDDKEAESAFRTNLLTNLRRDADANETLKTSFMKVFDLKKGLITAGIIALAPFIIKLFKKFDIGGLLTSLVSSVQTGFSEVGGVKGVVNNIGESTTNAKDVIKGEDTHYSIDENGNLMYDENGELVKETTKSSRISALLTPTKTRINTDTGEWENNKTWTGTSDSIANFAAHRATKVGKSASKIYTTGKTIGSGLKTVGNKAFDFATSKSEVLSNAYVHADDIIKTGKQLVSTTFENAKGKVSGVVTKAVNDDGIIGNAITMMKKALDVLVSKFTALGEKYGVKIGESALGSVLKSVRTIFDPKKLSKYTDKIAEFLKKITSKGTIAAGTLFLAEIGFALYGAIDGASNAGALFEVNPKDVDAKMRAISSVFKGLLNTSIGSWVDLINSLVYEILGFNFVKTIASHVYKLISNDKDDAGLEQAQKQFTEDYEKTVENEYNTYAESTKAQGQTPMSFEDFKASDLSTTRSEYNSSVNKSFAKKVVDKVQGVGKGIKNVGKTAVGTVTKVKTAASNIGNTKLVKGAKNNVTDLLNKGKGVFDDVGDSITRVANQGAEAAKGITTGFANIKSAFNNKDNNFFDYINADVNPVSDDNAFHGLVSGVLNVSKLVMFPKLVLLGILGKVGTAISNVVKNVFSGAKNAVSDFSTNTANLNKLALSGDINGLTSYEITTSDDDPIGGIVSSITGISRILHYPVALVALAGKKVIGTIKGAFNTIGKVGSTVVGGISQIGSMALTGDIAGINSYSGVDEDGNPIAPFANSILGASKFIFSPIAMVTSAGRNVANFIKTSVGKASDLGTKVKGFIGTLNGYTNPDKSLNGWDNESMSDDNDVVGSIVSTLIKKVMWIYVGIVRSVKSAFDWIGNTASDVKDSVTNKATSVKNTVVDKVKQVGSTAGNFINNIGTSIMNLGRGGNDGGRPIGGKGGSNDELNGMPYYSQNDPRYKNKPYKEVGGRGSSSDETMGERGCGPTAMAMVASKATGKEYNPVTMAKMAEVGGYSTSVGTTPGYFGAAADTLGIANRRDIPTADNLAGSLASGNSVILQGVRSGKGNSPYTSEGHYVTATGVNGNNVIVNDPRGREYSGEYKMSDVMNDTVGMWSFGGTGGFGSPKAKFYKLKGIVGGFGTAGDTSKWLNIVREVKKAIASQKPGYSQSRFIKITVGGKPISVRTDCSGYVSACLKYFGVLGDSVNLTSRTITNQSDPTMRKTGFTPGGWSGWDSLKEGDILALNGHTEIFAYNKDGKHYVYNCGSDSSVNSPTPTVTGHPNGYQTVWRCGSAGTGVVSGSASVDGTSTDSTSGSTSSGGVSSISEALSGAASAATNSIMEGLGLKVSDNSSGSSDGTSVSNDSIESANLSGSGNAQKIWNYFKSKGLTNEGTAGLMGNMQQESGLNPINLQNSYEKKLGYTDQSYTSAVDNGSYNNFVNDSAGYGLVQWTYHSLKQELLNYKKQTGKSIGDLGMQLGFLTQQLQTKYPGVWSTLKSTNSIQDATNKVMLEFERPADQSQSAKNRRAGFSKSFYNSYAGGGKGGNDGGRPIKTSEQTLGGYGKPKHQKVSTASSSMQDTSSAKVAKIVERNNTIKSLSSDETSQLLKVMIDYLSQIVDNTEATSSELETLNNKDFGTKTTNNTVNNTNNSYTKSKKKSDKTADRSGYEMAKRIAAGILV